MKQTLTSKLKKHNPVPKARDMPQKRPAELKELSKTRKAFQKMKSMTDVITYFSNTDLSKEKLMDGELGRVNNIFQSFTNEQPKSSFVT